MKRINVLLSLCPVGLKLALLQKSIFAEIYISRTIYIYDIYAATQPGQYSITHLHFSFCIMVCEQQEFQCLIVVIASVMSQDHVEPNGNHVHSSGEIIAESGQR